MDFVSAIVGSFFGALGGALGGALVVIYLSHRREQKMTLATINSQIASIGFNLNKLLLLKKQHALPHKEELDQIKSTMAQRNQVPGTTQVIDFKTSLNHIFLPIFVYDYSIKGISLLTHKNSDCVAFLSNSKNLLNELSDIGLRKNQLVREVLDAPGSTEERAIKYMGFEEKQADNRLVDITNNFLNCIDSALFFNNKSILVLQKIANEYLHPCYRGKVAKITIPDDYKKFMPTDDHIKGY